MLLDYFPVCLAYTGWACMISSNHILFVFEKNCLMKLFSSICFSIFFAVHSLLASNYQEKKVFTMTACSTVKDLSVQFAKFFTSKDADGIGSLLTKDFALYDPALKWVRGREAVVDVIRKQFQETKNVSYQVVNVYEDGNMGILEFKITLNELVLYGVDFMQWENGKMTELRCYYNQPNSPSNEELKPLSSIAKSFVGGEIYEHYKGKRYRVLSVGRNSETLEESIVYQALYGNHDIWIRPLTMFLEDVSINGQLQPRFKRVQ